MTTTMPPRTDAQYWREVLTAGGATPVPRWTRAPAPGTALVEAVIPAALDAELAALAASTGVSPASLLLAAHAKVLAALTGEPAVMTGYVAVAGTGPLPCRLTVAPSSWRTLALLADRTASQLRAHRDFPLDDLRRELGAAAATPETVLDPTGSREPDPDTVLHVSVAPRDARSVLRLRYRTDVLDQECAARIAGYHLAALRLAVAGPDMEHGQQSLLSGEELSYQLDALAGPHRDLPDQRFHELFEQRVRTHPDRVAAVHSDREWTYRELNVRANRLAHALTGAGLERQGVVGVVAERSLGWLAAVLAILKAGAVYLPVEPHFPAGRIVSMLSRAHCRLVLAESGSTASLDRAVAALPDVRTLSVGRVCEEGGDDRDPGIAVSSHDLAYVYFTSGSTGEPKGAMCEHGGMLNHLYAKTDDLGIGEGDVVAQTAPQCFDISLWQLLSPLLAGGRTLIVGQEAVLDVRQYLDTVAGGRVCVLQMVPSYLDVVLTYLEQHPRELPFLRCVSVTGEALRKDLVRRWFAVAPGIALVNSYGLTETSDDTNHAVLHRVPETAGVPLGRPVGNVRVYLVDEHLTPVPLGAPGAIAFSGICVGRGYINDPERTLAAFLPDPFRPGERLHLGGDYGRWLPDGQLEFLGRRDSQVKIRGFRIEIGEIENALLRVPGVSDGAVVVTGPPGNGRYLLAYYSGAGPLPAGALRDRLGETLPAYMVPSAFHWLRALPLTANGKTDRTELTLRASQSTASDEPGDPPRTPTELRLAAVWADVLGVTADRFGRRDHFFDRGGTSLSAVRLVIALDREISLGDLRTHPVLTDLADLLDERSAP
ncbi:amino acid adenylation domain-containing protein [Streptomyces sp. NPDC091265]|uniref:non-ribosomal peptide synthetase n=1 Tax=unclassified Streptomyces TaxID=2593676 RepID=UPI00344D30B5